MERELFKVRPALVVSTPYLGPKGSLRWAMMITSADNLRWPGDILLDDDHLEFGLPAPSLIRTAKIAAIAIDGASVIGQLSGKKRDAVWSTLRHILGCDAV